jgi:uncharacterized damage-inducible protein DinB
MNLSGVCQHILGQLHDLVLQIEEKHFTQPSSALGQSTVGQHLRHTLEFFLCLEKGITQGIINYDKRAHDKLIETDKFVALSTLDRIARFVAQLSDERQLRLEVSYDLTSDHFLTVETNAVRELVYNIEHAVHHMALMKIGVCEVAPYIALPADFGVAASTIRHKHETAKVTVR